MYDRHIVQTDERGEKGGGHGESGGGGGGGIVS